MMEYGPRGYGASANQAADKTENLIKHWERPENHLSKFFNSKEEFQQCIQSAIEGDDQAQFRLALALFSPAKSTSLDYSPVKDKLYTDYLFGNRLDAEYGTSLIQMAAAKGNPHALSFEDSFVAGNRSITSPYPFYINDPFQALKDIYLKYDGGMDCLYASPSRVRHDAALYGIWPLVKGAPPSMEFVEGRVNSGPSSTLVGMIERCAFSGNPEAAKALSQFYESKNFPYLYQPGPNPFVVAGVFIGIGLVGPYLAAGAIGYMALEKVFGEEKTVPEIRPVNDLNGISLEFRYQDNKLHDPERAKYWSSVNEFLLGKTPTLPVAKSLIDLHPNKNKQDENLYDLGWAHVHNQNHRDYDYGIDLLKHSAILGNRNAAWLLGKIHENSNNEYPGLGSDISTAVSWYKEAADLKHANAASRLELLTKKNGLSLISLPTYELSTPREEYLLSQPHARRGVNIPEVNLEFLIARRGDIKQDVSRAIDLLEGQINPLYIAVSLVQHRMEQLHAALKNKKEKIEQGDADWRSGATHNEDIHREIIKLEKERSNINRKTALEAVGYYAVALGAAFLIGDMTGQSGEMGSYIMSNVFRPHSIGLTGGKAISSTVEKDKINEKLGAMYGNFVNLEELSAERNALITEMAEFESSLLAASLEKETLTQKQILVAYARLILLYRGADNCETLERSCKREGLKTIDDLINAFETPVSDALRRFSLGIARSVDLATLSAKASEQHDDPTAAERALHDFAKNRLWKLRDTYFRHASTVDLMERAGLTDFTTNDISIESLSKIEAQALLIFLSSESGINIGIAHTRRTLFSLGVDRHGRALFFDDYIREEGEADITAAKTIETLPEHEIHSYIERVTRAYAARSATVPIVKDNLFLRICAYEYCFPQAVKVDGANAIFANNPTGPAAYVLANEVIEAFIGKLGFDDVTSFRASAGQKLQSLIAVSFVDFFSDLGEKHSNEFLISRNDVEKSFRRETYPESFTRYLEDISHSALSQFTRFSEILQKNIAIESLINSPSDVAKLREQLSILPSNYLSSIVNPPRAQVSDRVSLATREAVHPYFFLAPGNVLASTLVRQPALSMLSTQEEASI